MYRTPITSIYIICEGRNTEPIYLERIKEEVEDDNYLAISIYPDKNDQYNKSDPIGLINEAIQNKSHFDEIYVVYDKDGYTKHKEAFELLESHKDKVKLIFSSISFETWILLHFEKCTESFSKSKDILEKKFVGGSKYLPSYEKKGAFDLFPLIKNKTKQALINAAWLRYIERTSIKDKPIYDLNPYTDVDSLIKRLYNIGDNYYYAGNGLSIKFDSIDFSLSSKEGKASLTIINQKAISFTTNQLAFYNDVDFRNIIRIKTSILDPNQSITLDFGVLTGLILKFGSNVIFFDLIK